MKLGDPAEAGEDLTGWRMWEVIPLDRTRNQIHGRPDRDPDDQPTSLTRAIARASATPLGQLSVEELRKLIGQGIDEEFLVPLVLPHLLANPLICGTYFDGDVLQVLLATRGWFIQANPAVIPLVLRFVARVELTACFPPQPVDSDEELTVEQWAGDEARQLLEWLVMKELFPWSPWNGFDWEAHWRLPDPLPLERSLDQLEGRPGWWPKRPEGEVHRALDAASATPIGALSLAQVELLIRHQEGVPWLLPRALEAVGRDPLVRAGERAGDLLEALVALQLPELWRVHPIGAGFLRRALAKVEERAGTIAPAFELLERLERRGLWPRA